VAIDRFHIDNAVSLKGSACDGCTRLFHSSGGIYCSLLIFEREEYIKMGNAPDSAAPVVVRYHRKCWEKKMY